jgi:hypothetical protein
MMSMLKTETGSRVYASSLSMRSDRAQYRYSALPALDGLVGFIKGFEDTISYNFSSTPISPGLETQKYLDIPQRVITFYTIM